MKPLILAVVLVISAGGPVLAQTGRNAGDPVIDTLLLRAVTRTLAHDSLGGRDTGSPGAAAAARIIGERLRSMGLRPGTRDGMFTQPVPIVARSVDPASSLALHGTVDSAVFALHRDFVVLLPDTFTAGRLDGEPWYLGTGQEALTAMRASDVRGRIPVVFGGLPERADSTMREWAAQGAAALLLAVPGSDAFARAARGPGAPRLSLAGRTATAAGPPLPVLVAGERLARALLDGVSLPPRAAGESMRAVRLPARISAALEMRQEPVEAVNVVGMIPGRDPALRKELVVYTAHYDHVGSGAPDEDGDTIYNGFSDNAAGVGMLLAIADVMRRDPPARSVAFLFLTGEERGLFGSSHAAAEPPWPGGLAAVKAVINLDGGAPPRPPVSWRIAGGLRDDGTATPLGAVADSIVAANGWGVRLETARPNSDYWPFAERGVPALFLIPGDRWEDTTAEERDALRERWDRYHEPGDEYREDFPFSGLERYAALALAIGAAAANSR